jgi:hypothetical protein
MIVAKAKVSLRDRDLAVEAEAEFHARVAASRVGANQVLAVDDILRNHKMSGLRGETRVDIRLDLDKQVYLSH